MNTLKTVAATIVTTLLFLGPASPGHARTEGPLVKLRMDLDREILVAGRPQRAVIKVSFGVPDVPRRGVRPPVNLALALDRSGSMSGRKIRKAREAAVEALGRLSGDDMFALVVYDHEVLTLVPAQRVADTDWIADRIMSIQARGNTALFGGVSQAAAEARKSAGGRYVSRVILLSDGLANVGPSSPQDLGRLGAALRKEGISVTTIGIGNGFNEDLMARLAERSDGNHYFVESSQDLPRIFAAELGDVLTVAVRKVVVEIECEEGVRPLRIIGRDGRIRGNRVELTLNQLYGGQEKYALVEVEIPAGAARESRPVATANIRYENVFTRNSEIARATSRVRFSEREFESKQSVNRAVQESLVENEMAVARDRALDYYKEGKKQEAARQLRITGRVLRERSLALGLDDLAGKAGVLEQDAVEFEANAPLPEPKKKEIRSDSYRIRRQQKAY